MKALTDVLVAERGSKAERIAAQKAFLARRREIWEDIKECRFPISDLAQRDLVFYVLRDREVFPNRTGAKFYCCPRCTSKLHECVSAKVFRYIGNAKWQTAIETGQRGAPRTRDRASRVGLVTRRFPSGESRDQAGT
jgi:hypothetical protein